MERLREWFRAMHVLGPRWTVFVASMVGINSATLLLLFYFLRHWMPFKQPPHDWVFENGPPLFWALFGLMVVTSVGWALHMEHRLARWYCRGGPPTALELRTALTAPLQQSLVHLGGWAIGAAVFIAIGAAHDSKWTLATIIGCLQSATGSFGLTYLLGERILRPIAAKALSASEFHGRFAPSVFVRVRLSWWIGTLAPAIGIIALCGMALWKPDDLTSTRGLALTVLLIVSTTLVASYGLALLTAGQLADPVRQLRSAITDVAQGNFDARVDVYDGSELGVLQAGFNRMMQVGEERRQLRELFGKHVGADVASQALQLGTNLGGENRYVAVFFVDMIGSTSMAADRAPRKCSRFSTTSFASWWRSSTAAEASSTNSSETRRSLSSARRCIARMPPRRVWPPHASYATGSRRISRIRSSSRSGSLPGSPSPGTWVHPNAMNTP